MLSNIMNLIILNELFLIFASIEYFFCIPNMDLNNVDLPHPELPEIPVIFDLIFTDSFFII